MELGIDYESEPIITSLKHGEWYQQVLYTYNQKNKLMLLTNLMIWISNLEKIQKKLECHKLYAL